jgi:hypothetical protein
MFIHITHVPTRNGIKPCKTSQKLWQDNQQCAQISKIRLSKIVSRNWPFELPLHTAQCSVPQTPGRHSSLGCYGRKRSEQVSCSWGWIIFNTIVWSLHRFVRESGFNVLDLCAWQDDVFKFSWHEYRQLNSCLCVLSSVLTGQVVKLSTQHNLVQLLRIFPSWTYGWTRKTLIVLY